MKIAYCTAAPVGQIAVHGALAAVLAILCALAAPPPAYAAPEEIEVYQDDLKEPGKWGVDLHNSYVFSGRRTPDYPGEQPPGRVYRLTPEFTYGLTPQLELGLYVLTSRNAQGDFHADGSKVRIRYIAPHDAQAGFFWGGNVEVGSTSRRVSETRWTAELKGIFGYRQGLWTFALNPNLDWGLSRGGGPVAADVDFKVSYDLGNKTAIGIESYNEIGPLKHLSLSSDNGRILYAVVDKDLGKVDLNAGIGRGLTGASDRWVLKFIVGKTF
jgi:hypothetical protein